MDEIKNTDNILPKDVRHFQSKFPNGKLHNVYVVESVDKNGNVTDKKYAVNLMTDYGLKRCWNYNMNVCIGTDSVPSFSDTTMNSPFPDSSTTPTGDSSVSEKIYDIEYNPITHLVTQTKRIGCVYYNYNYQNISSPVTITSIGLYNLSKYPNEGLIYKSAIYDSQGQPSSIVKNPNERLYITIYITAVTNIDIINTLYEQGTYFLTDFYSESLSRYENGWYAKMLNTGGVDANSRDVVIHYTSSGSSHDFLANPNEYTSDTDEDTFDSIEHTRTLTQEKELNILFEDPSQSLTGFLVGGGYKEYSSSAGYASDLVLAKFNVRRDTPEELVTNFAQTDDIDSLNFFKMFKGMHKYSASLSGTLPVADFTITSLKRFNQITGEFDTNVPYQSNPSLDYNDATWYNPCIIQIGYPGVTWYDNSDKSNPGVCMVFVNTHTEYEIESFTYSAQWGNASRWAMTDEYWNLDSYVEVLNINNIPAELRHKRYIICLGGSRCVYINIKYAETPVSQSSTAFECNRLDITNTPIDLSSYVDAANTYDGFIHSDVDNYIVFKDFVIFNPDSALNINKASLVFPTGNSNSWYCKYERYADDDGRLLILTCNITNNGYGPTALFIYDMTDPTVQQLTPVSVELESDYVSPYGSGVSSIGFSKNGYISLQHDTSGVRANQLRIIDYKSATPGVIATLTSDIGTVGIDSNYVVYHDNTNILRCEFVVYDCSTQTEVERFYLPDGLTYTINAMLVWKDHVYIRYTDSQSTTNVYYHKILSGPDQLSSLNGSYGVIYDYWNYRNSTSGDKSFGKCFGDICIISGDISFIEGSNPTEIKSVDLGRFNSNYYGSGRRVDAGFSTDGKTFLATAMHNLYPSILDFGLCMYCTKRNESYQRRNLYETIKNHILAVYKDYIVDINSETNTCYLRPFEQLIPLQMKGTTYTITAYNNPVKITGSFTPTITVTNDMSKVRPAPAPDPVIVNNKYNVYNTYTGETTYYDDQVSAAAYIRNHAIDIFDVEIGSEVTSPSHDGSTYWSGVHLLSNTWNNLDNIRTFKCNDLVNWVQASCFEGSSIEEFIFTGIGPNPSTDGSHFVLDDRAFANCTDLTSFTAPQTTLVVLVGDEIFTGSGLVTADLTAGGPSVGIGVSSWMGSDIFANCTSLTTASVYVTEDTIESPPSLTGMFKGCSSLTSVDLDSNHNNAFILSNTTFTNTVNVNLTFHYWEENQKNGYPWGGTALNVTYDLNT